MNYGPWYTTRCENIHQTMDAVSTNRGKMYLSGQHCPFAWDTMTVAEQIIAEKLGMDVIEVATRNLHGPEVAERYVPGAQLSGLRGSRQEADEVGSITSPAPKSLPDGRMHGMAFRYQMCPRHALSDYTATVYLRGGKVYMPTQGPCTGMYAADACRHGGGGRDGRQVGRCGH